MEEWKKFSFTDCLVANKVGRSNQINASEIKPFGKYPVIDQGQDFIAGYTDEDEKVVSEGLPFVIFGDHTRCFKYVDFPFVVGADGTKVLSPNKELFDPKFFYYQLLSFNIPSRGYNRHYKLLKEKIIHRPELPEQRKIAYILSTVQKAIEQQDKLIRTTTELKKALMQKLFTEGLPMAEAPGVAEGAAEAPGAAEALEATPRKMKQTEIGLAPESWEVVEIKTLFDIQQGKQVSKSNRIGENQKPFLRTANIFWGHIDFSELDTMHFSTEEEIKFKLQNDDLLVCEGGDIGRTAIWKYDRENIYYQNHLHRLRRISDEIISKYFMYWMNFIVVETTYVKDAGNRTTIPNLSKSRLGGLLFPKPDLKYQKQCVQLLESIDTKIEFHQKKKQTLSDLFKTLLHELMTGQRRVHEIEFETLTKAYRIEVQPLSIAAEK